MTFEHKSFIHPRYRLLPIDQIQEGETGLPAWDLSLGERVTFQQYVNLTEADWEQFHATGAALERLVHPNLPRLRDALPINAQTGALVWQSVEGESLEAWLKRRGGPLPAFQMLDWVRQVGEAMAALHSLPPGFAGLDIRPRSVRITPDGRAVLVDFNLGTDAGPSIDETLPGRTSQDETLPGRTSQDTTLPGRTALTDPSEWATLPGRSAPPNRAVTQPSARMDEPGETPVLRDIYDLGVLLFSGLAGEAPPDLAARRSGRLLPDLRSLNPEISPELEAVILKAIHIAPQERFASVREFLDALDQSAQRRVAIRLSPDGESRVFPLEQLILEQDEDPAAELDSGAAAAPSYKRRLAFQAPALAVVILIFLALAGLTLAGGNDPRGAAGSLTPAVVENALVIRPLESGDQSEPRQAGRGSPTPAAAQVTLPPLTATPLPPKATTPAVSAAIVKLVDWRENSFMPMFTGCPISTAQCVRSDTNRSRDASLEGYSAVMLLRDPIKIDTAWDRPSLVFVYRVRALNLASVPGEARSDTPPPTLRVRSTDFELLAETVLADTEDEWQPAEIDLSAYRGQEISFQFTIGKYWGMMFLNDVRVVPNYSPPVVDPTDPLEH